jgi:hypothetical protein
LRRIAWPTARAVQVERDWDKFARRAAQQRRDAVDRALDLGRRRGFGRLRLLRDQLGARLAVARFGQLHAADAARAPGDAATAERRVEEGKADIGHGVATLALDSAKLTPRETHS